MTIHMNDVCTWKAEGKTMYMRPFNKTVREACDILKDLRELMPEENWTMQYLGSPEN